MLAKIDRIDLVRLACRKKSRTHKHPRCAPWRAKRRRVVPDRRRRERIAEVAKGRSPEAAKAICRAHPRRRRAICGRCRARRTNGESGTAATAGRIRAQRLSPSAVILVTWSPKMYHEHGDTPALQAADAERVLLLMLRNFDRSPPIKDMSTAGNPLPFPNPLPQAHTAPRLSLAMIPLRASHHRTRHPVESPKL